MDSKQAGFSLMGVLIAVMIIGIMAAVAVPKLNSAVIAAHSSRIAADLSTLDSAIAIYEVEHSSSPSNISDLADYVRNIDGLTPPKGTYRLKDGTTGEVTDETVYQLTVPKGNLYERQASLNGHTVEEFGK